MTIAERNGRFLPREPVTYTLSLRPSSGPDSQPSSHEPLSPQHRRALARTLAWALRLERQLLALYALIMPAPQFFATQRRVLEMCFNDHLVRARRLERGLERLKRGANQRSPYLLSWLVRVLLVLRPRALPRLVEHLEKRTTRLYRERLAATSTFPTELISRQHFTEASAWHAVHGLECSLASLIPAPLEPR